jgi:murein DD-endopeptidase MepM/ murein hydrolase activator NlpD
MRPLAAALALAMALAPLGLAPAAGAIPVPPRFGAAPVPLGTGATPVERGDWHWPVAPPRSIARPFIAPTTEYGPGHRGIDVRAGDAVLFAPADGIVHFAGVVVSRPVLSIRHGADVISSFEPVVALVAAGDAVSRGQPIGTIIAGHCATPCVHVGVRVDGEYVSPLAWFGGIPRSILLPTRWEAVAGPVTASPAHGRISAWDSWMTPRASTSRRSVSGAPGSSRTTRRRRACSSSRGARPRDGPR